MRNNFYTLETKEVFRNLKSKKEGISNKEALARIRKYGPNVLPEKKDYSYIKAFFKQFKSLFIYVLLVAGIISYLVGHYLDVYIIGFVIILNSTIGFFQEQKAEKAIKALKKLVVTHVKVLRDGTLIQIKTKNLVLGDIIHLEEGDKIPADSRIIEINNFTTVESSLTGESSPIVKKVEALPERTIVADRLNMVFFGTFVASGSAKAIVVGTGKNTEIGKIADSINQIERSKHHFQKKIDRLAIQMGLVAFIGAFVIFLIGFFIRDLEFSEIFLFTISALVSGIPEGLPAVLSIVLAVGALKLSKKNAIMRNLQSTETLGVVNTIITDKTGTLTENTMTIRKILLASKEINVTGQGFRPRGEFFEDGRKINPLSNQDLKKLLSICSICNNSNLVAKKGDMYSIIGDPTEASLVVLAEKAGLKKSVIEKREKRIDDMPFNQQLKYRASLSVLVDKKKDKDLYVIGAPENVIENCKFVLDGGEKVSISNYKEKLNSKLNEMTDRAMRVLAVAYRDVDNKSEKVDNGMISNLTLVGFVGMIDPPRKGVKESILKAKNAGIRVIMATGDHKRTAVAIAKEIGLVREEKREYPLAMSGEELEELSKSKFKEHVYNVDVFARLTPNLKLRIAKVLKEGDHVVAMTGDGINDAPALKKADIGISMGIIGTDVARESSELILADDNFSTIIDAVEQGRVVFNNTKQTSFFLVTTSIAEFATIIVTLILKWPLPLLPTQILWLNMVTDTGAGIGLATEPGHNDVLSEPPRKAKENVISKDIFPYLMIIVFAMLIATLFIFNSYSHLGIEKARTGAFAVMALTQIFNIFNMKSLRRSLFEIGILNNKLLLLTTAISLAGLFAVIYVPFLQNLMQFAPLSLIEVLSIVVISSSVLFLGEGYKYFARGKIKK